MRVSATGRRRLTVPASSCWPRTACRPTRLRTLWFEVAALLRAGDRAAAAETLAAFVSRAGDSRRCHVTRLRADSELAPSPDERLALLRQARDVARELDPPLEVRELDATLAHSATLRE